jgi:hypothetical protein
LIDTVERLKQLDKLVGELARKTGGSSVVLVSNDTGANLPQYSVVRLDGLKLSDVEVKTEIAVEAQPFSGKTITDSTQWHRLAIVQNPIADGAVGYAKVSGISYVLLEVSDSSHIRAFPDGTSCKSGAGPLRILHAPSPGDEQPAIVVFDYGTQHYLAKASADIAAGSGGTVKIMNGLTLTDIEITAKNVSGTAVEADKLLGIQEESSQGTNYINWEECSLEEEP